MTNVKRRGYKPRLECFHNGMEGAAPPYHSVFDMSKIQINDLLQRRVDRCVVGIGYGSVIDKWGGCDVDGGYYIEGVHHF